MASNEKRISDLEVKVAALETKTADLETKSSDIEARLALVETMFHKRGDGQMSLNIATGLKLSDGEKLTQLFSDVTNAETLTFPNESQRLTTYRVVEMDSAPTGNQIANGTWKIVKNTTTGETRVWSNDNGVLKNVKLT